MIAKYLAISAGVIGFTMLSSVGFANAETKVPAGNQRVVLSDTQMGKVTAGHLYTKPHNNNLHYGYYWSGVGWHRGWHRGCGVYVCGGW
jgi:hypothetical protein